jgi:hypothetical protein
MSACLCPSRPAPGDRLGGKIQAAYLARCAIVYVRQSTMQPEAFCLASPLNGIGLKASISGRSSERHISLML